MHRPTIIFLLSHKNTTVQQKKNQPEQSITSNYQKKQSTQSLNQKHPKNKPSKQTRQTISSINRKINHTNNHDKQSTQPLDKKNTQKQTQKAITKKRNVFEYKISQTATTSEPTAYTLFIKTQYNRKRQNNILHAEVIIKQTRKSKTLYF